MAETVGIPLINRAEKFYQKTALVSDNTAFSFEELLNYSKNAACFLLNGEADLNEKRVAFMVDPGAEYVFIQWAIWRAGGIAVPLCNTHPLPAISHVIEDSGAELIITSQKYISSLSQFSTQGVQLILAENLLKGKIKGILPDVAVERRAMIIYTSGTTSKPKGVVSTHEIIQNQIECLVDAWKWRESDYILNVLPLHHLHGILNILCCALWAGATCEFLPKFSAKEVWDKFMKGNINLFMAVPTIYSKLIREYEDYPEKKQKELKRILEKFRLMVSGSAALPVPVLEKWKNISGHFLLERYGMTEIGMALSNPYEGERKAGFVGCPLPNVDLKLVDENGNKTNEGEIYIKGPMVFKEYWNNNTATQEAFKEGWFQTGDRATIVEGYYKILGRNSVDIIKSGGYKISALEIEEVLLSHNKIKECGVIGIEDEEWGEKIYAALVCNGSKFPEPEKLKKWLRNYLPAYKIPAGFIEIDKMPRNVMGKITKNKLREIILKRKL
ncbi:acyl-CoA synthetase [Flexithrix dorotheae]|uniref:acyl-CoA synthetase n=1 Tax=Flexithrix dorotheae TaxID=70993 RepID=UPI00037EDEF6|nr:acyl-CoA synthetase [Flexithrix dorotheae]